MRNFVCAVTEVHCDRGECKKGVLCILEKEHEIRRRESEAPRRLAARKEEADVASMMLAIAKKDVLDAFRAKHGKQFNEREEVLAELANRLLTRPDYAQRARETAVDLVKSVKEAVAKLFATGAL